VTLADISEAERRGERPLGSLFIALMAVGIVARFLLPVLGHNFDFESYRIVGDIVTRGGNVYAETTRYNYGPIWFLILGAARGLAALTSQPEAAFRFFVVAVLTAADAAIAFILRRQYGDRVALLFFLNPVSILITGYHSQFDNVAIAAGLAAMQLGARAEADGDRRRWLASLGLLGVALTIKHIFFLLPLWLAFRAKGWPARLTALTLPVAIFLASFLPFLTASDAIVQNVFLYRSFPNGLLFREVADAIPPALLLILGLAIIGYLVRKRPLFESALLYLVALVVLSPAMANQYLAIPVAAVAAQMNPLHALYTLVASLVIVSNPDGLGLGLVHQLLGPSVGNWLEGRHGYDLPVVLLAFGTLWSMRSRTNASG
jgi:hypothetical protein